MWRDLTDVLKIVPEYNYETLRKYRFPVKVKSIYSQTLNWMFDKNKYEKGNTENVEGFRLGKIFKGHFSTTVNLVPINNPSGWVTSSASNLEIFITAEEWEKKIFPIIFAAPK